jgi:3-deoxy-manno-octulosonate cytidylyltransferase (CMP-KDO synthetase)
VSDPIVLIPARLKATRLPDKPLADIGGEPMIVHVWRRACEAGIGPVAVATDAASIVEAIEKAGGKAVMTRDDHASGSDRIFEAAEILDPEGRHEIVVNVQGDFPTIEPAAIAASVEPLDDPAVDIATLAAEITEEEERTNPNVVKLVGSVVAGGAVRNRRLRALYFTRATAPYGEGPLYHHVGLYAFRRRALARFVKLPPSPLEKREKLEQLRALEAGMRIDAIVLDHVPFGVDTPEYLERARAVIAAQRTS